MQKEEQHSFNNLRGSGIKEGEWVNVRYMSHAYFGYVQQVFEDSNTFKLRIVKKISSSNSIHYADDEFKTFGINQADLLEDNCKEEDYASMIDLALMTGDQEWFNELVAKMNGAESVSVQQNYYADGKAARNTVDEISLGFASIGKALIKAFGNLTKQLTDMVESVKQYEEKSKERSKHNIISCRKGWRIEKDNRKKSQVMIKKPKFVIRNLI